MQEHGHLRWEKMPAGGYRVFSAGGHPVFIKFPATPLSRWNTSSEVIIKARDFIYKWPHKKFTRITFFFAFQSFFDSNNGRGLNLCGAFTILIFFSVSLSKNDWKRRRKLFICFNVTVWGNIFLRYDTSTASC